MLNEKNFWNSTVESASRPDAALPSRVDVAIVGGGYAGLSAARVLARSGARVAVLEQETVGWGASSRNAGMVLTGMKLGPEALVKKYGEARARRMFAFSLSAIDTVERIVNEERIACGFVRSGHLEAAWKPAHFAGYAAAAEFMEKTFGHRVQVIPKADLHAEIGSDLYHGGMVDEVSASVNPEQFVLGLADAARRAGALIHEQTRVRSMARAAGRFTVATDRGTIDAERVFVGTGGYTGPATPALRRRVIPIGSYIIASAPLSDALARQVIPRRRMVFDSKHFLYYFRLTPDNRMLFGGRAAFRPETPMSTRRSAEILRQGMVQVFPQLSATPVEFVWGGRVDFTYDVMPHAGVLDDLYYAIGFGGHGVAIATSLGESVARQMLGQAADHPLDGLPFPAVPLYNGNPLVHLPAAWMYYKVLDWVS